MNKDYYAILGISSAASQEEIRLAYERLSAEKRIEAEEAYFVLSNHQTRSQYDRIYNNAFHLIKNFDGFDSSKIGRGSLIGTESTPNGPEGLSLLGGTALGLDLDVDFDDPEGILPENFTDIFQAAIKNIINAADQIKIVQSHEENLKNGVDIFLDFPINPQKAEKGGYIPLEYKRYIYCSQCQEKDALLVHSCPKCNGSGRVMAQRRVEIKIPKNTEDGAVLQVTNEGHAGGHGSSSGDLFVKVIIRDES